MGKSSSRLAWQWCFWLLVATSITTVLTMLPLLEAANDIIMVLYFGNLCLLCCAMGAWVGLGKRWRRFASTALGCSILGCIHVVVLGSVDVLLIQILCHGTAWSLAMLTWGLSVMKGRFVLIDNANHHADALQFGIKDVMIATGVMAVLIFAVKSLWGKQLLSNLDSSGGLGVVLILVITISIMTVVNLWALHGKELILWKLAAMVICAAVLVGVNLMTLEGEPWFPAAIAVLCETMAVMMMWTLRKQGYRFVKRSKEAA